MTDEQKLLADASAQLDTAMAELRDHLLIAPLAVWVDVVLRTDPSLHHDLLEWIIGQPECDLSIAQLVFYRANPATYLRRKLTIDPDAPYRDVLCLTIGELAAEGRYASACVGIDRRHVAAAAADLMDAMSVVEPEEWVFEIPDRLIQIASLHVETPDDVWLPEHDDDLLDLYARAGLQIEDNGEGGSDASAAQPNLLLRLKERLRMPLWGNKAAAS